MRKVFDGFRARGYYETFSGNRIYEADFKGVYVAGGKVPMTWDFDNLQKGVMIAGISLCLLGYVFHKIVRDDPPLISLGIASVGVVVVIIGRFLGKYG